MESISRIPSNRLVIMTTKHLSNTKIIRRKLWCQPILTRNTHSTKVNKSRWSMARLLSQIGTIIKQTNKVGINILSLAIKMKDSIVFATVLQMAKVRLKSVKCPVFHWEVKSLPKGKTIWRISVAMSWKIWCLVARKKSMLRSILQGLLIAIASL